MPVPTRWADGRQVDRLGVRHRLVLEHGDQLGERGDPEHLDAVDELGFPGLAIGHDHSPEPGLRGRQGRRQDAADGPDASVQTQLSEQHGVAQLDGLHHVGRRQHRGDDGEVVAAPLLRQGRRREVDRQQRVRPALLAAVHRRLAAVPRLVERGVRQSDQDRARQPGAGVGFHLHDPAVEADQSHRVRARETHWSPIPVTCTSTGWLVALQQHPDGVQPHPVDLQAVLAHPLGRELAEPSHLRPRDGLQRVAVVAAGAALDLAEHGRPPTVAAVQRDHVQLTPAAGPVAVQDLQTLPFQLERGQGLAHRTDLVARPSHRHVDLHPSSPHWGRRTEMTGVIRNLWMTGSARQSCG